mmetsp:Transcript_903/g.2043  ORF Transcript_903/g.2043 Transcript_903/m.2043 type:complete len:284 (+) Transcript_903:182-1033(+)
MMIVLMFILSAWLGESHYHTPLLRALHITLVITPDPIPHRDKVKTRLIKDIVQLGRKLQQPFSQSVIKMLLLSRIVERRMAQIISTVGNEVLLKLGVIAPRELLAEDDGFRVDGTSPLAKLVVLHLRTGGGGWRACGGHWYRVMRRFGLIAHRRGNVVLRLVRGGTRVVEWLVGVVRLGRTAPAVMRVRRVGIRRSRRRAGMVTSLTPRRGVPRRSSSSSLLLVVVIVVAAGRGVHRWGILGMKRLGRAGRRAFIPANGSVLGWRGTTGGGIPISRGRGSTIP